MAELFPNERRKKTTLLAVTLALFVFLIILLSLYQMMRNTVDIPEDTFVSIGGPASNTLRRPLAAMAVGNRIYVADGLDKAIKVFTLDGRLVFKFSGGGRLDAKDTALDYPASMALSPNGLIYVADANAGKIVIFDKGGRARRSLDLSKKWKGAKPIAVAFDKAGNLYVSEAISGKVLVFNKKNRFVKEFGRGKLKFANGIVVDDKRGRIYVADTNNMRILVFNRKGEAIKEFKPAGGKTFFPRSVALDKDGRLIAADTLNGRILFFDKNGRQTNQVSKLPESEPFFLPNNIRVSGDKLIIADRGLSQVFIVNLKSLKSFKAK